MNENKGFSRVSGDDIKALDDSVDKTVKSFELPQLREPGARDYSTIKQKYGALAVTDVERQARGQKDRRFSLSPIVRKTLSVEEEENRAIEERLSDRIKKLEAEVTANAYREGHQLGTSDGYQKAYEEFKAEASERVASFQTLLEDAENSKFNIFKANERFLIDLIYRIAKLVIHKDLEQDEDFLRRLVLSLLNRINVKENITIRLHPNDAQTMTKLRAGIEQELEGLKNLKIEISQKVKSGGCIIETDWNIVDASIDTQLQGVYDALMNQAAPKTDDGSEA